MVNYKLHYFPFRAMGEPMELMCLYTNTPLDIKRITMAEWPALKSTYQRGAIPVLEVDGKQLCEVSVIIKYLGDHLGLKPKDSWEDAKALEMANGYSDLYVSVRTFFVTPYGEEREKFIKEKQDTYARPFLASLEAALGNASGWVYDDISYADFAMHNLSKLLEHMWGIPISDYPKLAAHNTKLETQPVFDAYFKEKGNQPLTPFQPYKDVDGHMTDAFKASFAPKE